MEKSVAQRKGNERALAISPKPSETELAKLMAKTQARFPNCPLTEITATVYLEDWGKLAQEFGMVRFRKALEATWTRQTFFPLPGEIRAECEAAQEEPRIGVYEPLEPPKDPITKEEYQAMLDKFPQLAKWR